GCAGGRSDRDCAEAAEHRRARDLWPWVSWNLCVLSTSPRTRWPRRATGPAGSSPAVGGSVKGVYERAPPAVHRTTVRRTVRRPDKRQGHPDGRPTLYATLSRHSISSAGAGRVRPDPALPTQTARFFSLRRSRSLSPPHMPKRSSVASAYSRHSVLTSQERQTF